MKERGSNSAKIPYAIYPSKEIFGKFMLSYALRLVFSVFYYYKVVTIHFLKTLFQYFYIR